MGADGVLRAVLEEELDDLGESLPRGDVRHRAAIGVAEVGVGAAVEELADPLHAARVGQVHQLEAHDAVGLGGPFRRARAGTALAAPLGSQRRLLPQPEPRRRRLRRRRWRLRLHGGGRQR